MAMLPIYILGVVSGILLSIMYNIYRNETPSETKIRIQEAEIIRRKSDNDMLEKLVDKLYAKIDKLEKELQEKELNKK